MSEAGEDAHDDGQGEELFEHHRLVADPGQAPLRVDKFIINRVAHLSRNKLQTAAKSGYVRVNGEPVKSNHKVKPETSSRWSFLSRCTSLSCCPNRWTWMWSTRTTTCL